MARYTGPKEKIERRLGSKLFLKGARSLTAKSATVRRPYPPGQHGKRSSGRLSEFGQQLRSKQRVRLNYRMLEKQFSNWMKDAIASHDEAVTAIVKKLENRLDNVVYRLGLAESRDQARQIVNHGHITVNGKKAAIPSHHVKIGDEIKVRVGSMKSPYFATIVPQAIKKAKSPKWLDMNKDSLTGKVLHSPTLEDSGMDAKDVQAVIEYYSR